MSDDNAQVSHLVPEQLRDDAKEAAEYGELSEMVRLAYRIVAYGGDSDTAKLKMELAKAEREYERLSDEIDRLSDAQSDAAERVKRLRDEVEKADGRDEKYDAALGELETALAAGEHLFVDHAKVKEAAETGRVDPAQVITDLKERNPDIPDDAFVPAHKAEFEWHGT